MLLITFILRYIFIPTQKENMTPPNMAEYIADTEYNSIQSINQSIKT